MCEWLKNKYFKKDQKQLSFVNDFAPQYMNCAVMIKNHDIKLDLQNAGEIIHILLRLHLNSSLVMSYWHLLWHHLWNKLFTGKYLVLHEF